MAEAAEKTKSAPSGGAGPADEEVWPPEPENTGSAAARPGEATVHPSVVALDRFVDTLAPDLSRLIRDLADHGFGPFALGDAKALFEHFAKAADATRKTASARFAWSEVRNLALRLAQDSDAPAAGLELIDGLLKQTSRRPVPKDLAGQLAADRAAIAARLPVPAEAAAPLRRAEPKPAARRRPAGSSRLAAMIAAGAVGVVVLGVAIGVGLRLALPAAGPAQTPAPVFADAGHRVPAREPALRDESWAALLEPATAGPAPLADGGALPDAAASGPSIDLLDIGQASRVQQELAELGYFDGPVDGIWGPRSRSALLSFKRANGLAADEQLDRDTGAILFSVAAMPASGPPEFDPAAWDRQRHTPYAPPRGGTLNPLNQADAIRIQDRLAELGFYPKRGDGVWGIASRQALRDFKTVSGLAVDDIWNALTERRLGAVDAPRATNTIIGLWTRDLGLCPSVGDPRAPMLRITTQSLDANGRACSIDTVRKSGRNWFVTGACGGEAAAFHFSVFGDRLIDQAERSRPYLRCVPDLAPRIARE